MTEKEVLNTFQMEAQSTISKDKKTNLTTHWKQLYKLGYISSSALQGRYLNSIHAL
jgi:hypothetical protein